MRMPLARFRTNLLCVSLRQFFRKFLVLPVTCFCQITFDRCASSEKMVAVGVLGGSDGGISKCCLSGPGSLKKPQKIVEGG